MEKYEEYAKEARAVLAFRINTNKYWINTEKAKEYSEKGMCPKKTHAGTREYLGKAPGKKGQGGQIDHRHSQMILEITQDTRRWMEPAEIRDQKANACGRKRLKDLKAQRLQKQ